MDAPASREDPVRVKDGPGWVFFVAIHLNLVLSSLMHLSQASGRLIGSLPDGGSTDNRYAGGLHSDPDAEDDAANRSRMTNDSPAIELKQLQVRYGSFVAVEGLDLVLPRGELFGLLGPNGAGKSTTVRVLIGQRKPSAGEAFVCGLDVVREWSKVKEKFGYVPDRDNHFDEFSGRRNLQIFGGLYGVDPSRIDECLEMVELRDAANLFVKNYSLGMRKKLLLARALLHDPPVLYLDEPTANLDIYSSAVVHRILRARVKQGHTVLMTTHNMQEVEQICDRVGIMCKGKLIALDRPMALRQRYSDKKAEVTLYSGERIVYDLEVEAERIKLAEQLSKGQIESMHTLEFDFHSTFMKLTGMQFD